MPDSDAKLLVLDVMPLLYRGHFALLNRPRMTSAGFNTSALFVFTNIVHELLANHGATHAALVMDTSPTFRHELYPAYKAQREKLPEDIAASVGPAEEFAKAISVPFLRVDGFEADDLMGTLAAQAEREGMTTWVVTPDKDMAQLVTDKTLLCRPGKAGNESIDLYDVARVREEWHLTEPAQMVDYLGMAGDSADNIPGFPGIGPKTASDLLQKYGSLEGVIAHASEIKGKTGEKILAAVEQGRLSRTLAEIRRDVPLGVTLDDLRIREPDPAALEAFCRQYELNKLLARCLPGQTTDEPLPLFAPPKEESAEPEKPLSTVATTPHDYHVVATERDLDSLAKTLSSAREITFDTETDGLDARHARCVGISLALAPGEAWYIPVFVPRRESTATKSAPAAPAQLDFFAMLEPAAPPEPEAPAEPQGLSAETIRRALGPVFANPAIAKCGHNLKFDIHVLRGLGIEVEGPLADSMLAHYVIDPAARHGMDPLAREYLSYDPIPIERLIGPRGKGQKTMDQVPLETIAEYAAEDADVSVSLHRALEPAVRAAGAWRAYDEAENPLVRVLADMEDAGIRIDVPALERYGRELQGEITGILADIQRLAGEPFNVDSPQQLGRILFEKLGLPATGKTSTGHYSTAEEALLDIRDRHEIVPLVLSYRAASKLKSTYVDKLPLCIDPLDGRVHTSFNQALTETGRLSSDNPNLQNIPVRTDRGKPIRAAFIAADDHHRLLSADYSQIELRMVAHLSGDEALIEAFQGDADIHRETAARVYGLPPEEVTKEQRSFCKQVNFGIIYGISAFGLAQRLGCTRGKADDLIKAYFEMFPGVRRYMDETIAGAREKGYVSTLLGRRRPLRDIASRNGTVRASAERNAINTPVQGSAADLVKLAMVRVHDALRTRHLAARLVLQVHDELVLDVPETEVAEVSALVKEAMESAMPLRVPLRADVGVGVNWLEAH